MALRVAIPSATVVIVSPARAIATIVVAIVSARAVAAIVVVAHEAAAFVTFWTLSWHLFLLLPAVAAGQGVNGNQS